jgi:hypothetical protein
MRNFILVCGTRTRIEPYMRMTRRSLQVQVWAGDSRVVDLLRPLRRASLYLIPALVNVLPESKAAPSVLFEENRSELCELLSEDVNPFAGLGIISVHAPCSVPAGVVRIEDHAVDDR